MEFNSNQKGYTIVELMIAIAVFSVIMLLVTIGIIQIARNYKQVSVRAKMEDASREIHQQIGQTIQFSGNEFNDADDVGGYMAYCFGTQRYLYKKTPPTTDNTVKLLVDTITDPSECGTKPLDPNSESPLPKNSKVVAFDVNSTGSGGVTIKTRFVIGDADMFQDQDYTKPCLGSVVGGEFCAVVELNSLATSKVISN